MEYGILGNREYLEIVVNFGYALSRRWNLCRHNMRPEITGHPRKNAQNFDTERIAKFLTRPYLRSYVVNPNELR